MLRTRLVLIAAAANGRKRALNVGANVIQEGSVVDANYFQWWLGLNPLHDALERK
jgi:hypothetical protein